MAAVCDLHPQEIVAEASGHTFEMEEHPMGSKTIGIVLIVVGVVVLIVSVAADSLGLGANPIFGFKQIVGTIVGVLLLLGGAWMAMRKPAK